MAIIYRNDSKAAYLAVWELVESHEELAPKLRCEFPTIFDNKQRILEWLSSRILLQEMLIEKGFSKNLEIDKDEFGKPYLIHQDQEISISHCKKYSAAIAGNRAVGIDIEHIGSKINRIADRFMHPSEGNGYEDQELTEYRYLIWCAKEAVYKLYGRKAVDFKDHMRVKPFSLSNEGSFELTFQKHDSITYTIQYRIFDQHAMAWVIA